jgi:hypothetical protein
LNGTTALIQRHYITQRIPPCVLHHDTFTVLHPQQNLTTYNITKQAKQSVTENYLHKLYDKIPTTGKW